MEKGANDRVEEMQKKNVMKLKAVDIVSRQI